MNAPLSNDESRRLEWIYQTGILDSPSDPAFDDITTLAARICDVPIAAISMIDAERQWFKSIIGMSVAETPRNQAFCAYTILQDDLLVVPDAREDERFIDNPLVIGQAGVRFYAGAPLVTSDGIAFGSLCVIDRRPRALTSEQLTMLEILARQVAGRIELQRRIVQQDITLGEHHRTHETLRENETRLRTALKSGRFGTWGFSLGTGERQEASDQTKALFGLPPEAVFSQDHFFQAVIHEDSLLVREASRKALENREYSEVEFRISWPDESIHWLCSHIIPVYDEAGEAVEIFGVTQEITERKEREAEQETALRQAEERADRDALTGLWNHRAFHRRLEEETARAQRTGSSLAVVMLDLNDFKYFNDVYGHAQGDTVLRMLSERLTTACRAYDVVARFGGDEFALLLPGTDLCAPAEIEARLKSSLHGMTYCPEGHQTIIPITVSLGAALLSSLTTDQQDIVQEADERLYRAKTGGDAETEADRIRAAITGRVTGFSMLDALVTAVDNKDRYTRQHSEDVMLYSLKIARELGMDKEARHAVAVSALIHDVGKIGVPDAILRKPGKLTDAEFEAVKQHPMMGAIMVAAVPGLEETLEAVRHHHERWDGDGYPARLKGEECPLIARLMAVADAFSAMTTDRPYRKGMERQAALDILTAGQGKQWDPECVQAFLRACAHDDEEATQSLDAAA